MRKKIIILSCTIILTVALSGWRDDNNNNNSAVFVSRGYTKNKQKNYLLEQQQTKKLYNATVVLMTDAMHKTKSYIDIWGKYKQASNNINIIFSKYPNSTIARQLQYGQLKIAGLQLSSFKQMGKKLNDLAVQEQAPINFLLAKEKPLSQVDIYILFGKKNEAYNLLNSFFVKVMEKYGKYNFSFSRLLNITDYYIKLEKKQAALNVLKYCCQKSHKFLDLGHKRDIDLLFKIIDKYMLVNDKAKTKIALDQFLEQVKTINEPEIRSNLFMKFAELYIKIGAETEGYKIFDKAIRKAKRFKQLDLLLQIANTYNKLGRKEKSYKALMLYLNIVKSKNGCPPYDAISLYLALGYKEEAYKLLTTAFNINFKSGVYNAYHILLNLILLSVDMGEKQKTEKMLTRLTTLVISQSPKNSREYMLDLANVCVRHGWNKQATILVKKIMTPSKRDMTDVIIRTLPVYVKLYGKKEEANKILQKSLTIHNIKQCALIYVELGEYSKAVKTLKKSNNLNRQRYSFRRNNNNNDEVLWKIYDKCLKAGKLNIILQIIEETGVIALYKRERVSGKIIDFNIFDIIIKQANEELLPQAIKVVSKLNKEKYLMNIIDRYKALGKEEQAEQVLSDALDFAVEHHLSLQTIVEKYAALGKFDDAFDIFEEMKYNHDKILKYIGLQAVKQKKYDVVLRVLEDNKLHYLLYIKKIIIKSMIKQYCNKLPISPDDIKVYRKAFYITYPIKSFWGKLLK